MKGHIARACKSRKKAPTGTPSHSSCKEDGSVAAAHKIEGEEEEEADTNKVYNLGASRSDPFDMTAVVNDQPIKMEIDTGAAVSICIRVLHAAMCGGQQWTLIWRTRLGAV